MPVSEAWQVGAHNKAYKLSERTLLFDHHCNEFDLCTPGEWIIVNQYLEVVALSDEQFWELTKSHTKQKLY